MATSSEPKAAPNTSSATPIQSMVLATANTGNINAMHNPPSSTIGLQP